MLYRFSTFTLLYVKTKTSTAAVIFGNNLRNLRKKQHLTQEKLAEVLDVSTKQIGDIESGKSFTTGQMMDNITKFFNVSHDELFLSEDQKRSIQKEAAKMASEMLKKNQEDFDKKYGVEFHLRSDD